MVDIDEYGVDEDEDDDERDSDKWTDYQTDRLLDSFVEFKPQFDAPYSKKNENLDQVLSVLSYNFILICFY